MTDVAANQKVASTDYAHGISFGEAFVVWLRVAMLSFGGPAGQIAVMHQELVERRRRAEKVIRSQRPKCLHRRDQPYQLASQAHQRCRTLLLPQRYQKN